MSQSTYLNNLDVGAVYRLSTQLAVSTKHQMVNGEERRTKKKIVLNLRESQITQYIDDNSPEIR